MQPNRPSQTPTGYLWPRKTPAFHKRRFKKWYVRILFIEVRNIGEPLTRWWFRTLDRVLYATGKALRGRGF